MAEKQILIDVKVNAAEVSKELGVLTRSLTQLKQEQKDLQSQFQSGAITATEYGSRMAENKKQVESTTRAIKSNTAILQAASIESVKSTQSLDEQRQALNLLQKAYGSLTEEQKNAKVGGKTLTERINELSDSVKKQEAAIGDNRRNVGNYAEALKEAGLPIDNFKKKMTALWKNPWAAIIGAIVVVIKKVIDAFKRSEDRMNEVKSAFAPLQGAADLVTRGFDKFAKVLSKTVVAALDGVLNGVKWVAKALDAIGKKIGKDWGLTEAFESASEKTEELTAAEIAYTKHKRKWVTEEANLDNQIAKLRDKSVQKDKYSAEQRIAFLEQAIALEKQKADERKRLAQEELNILELDAERAENDAEVNDRLAEARANVTKADTEYFETTRRLQTQLVTFRAEVLQTAAAIEEEGDATQEVAKEDTKAQEEREKAHAKLQQKILQWTQNDIQRLEAEMKADLETANITAEEKLAIEQHYQAEIAKIREQAMAEEAERQQADVQSKIAAAAQWIDAIMNAATAINDAVSAGEERQLAEYEANNEKKKKELESRLKDGLISQEDYDNQVAAMDADLAKKQKEIEIEQAKRNKAFGIMQAVINTALAIANAFATTPFPGSIVMAALAATTGAAQIATIAAEPLPQFATGGIVGGTSYTGDKVVARLNSGEGVLTAQGVQNAGAVLSAVDSGQIAGGIDYDLLGATMAQAVAAQPAPVMAYSEFQDFQKQTSTYKEIAAI